MRSRASVSYEVAQTIMLFARCRRTTYRTGRPDNYATPHLWCAIAFTSYENYQHRESNQHTDTEPDS